MGALVSLASRPLHERLDPLREGYISDKLGILRVLSKGAPLDVRTAQAYARLVHDAAETAERLRRAEPDAVDAVVSTFAGLSCDEVDERISTVAVFFARLPWREQRRLAERCPAWARLTDARRSAGRP
jgi:hypothetical protein